MNFVVDTIGDDELHVKTELVDEDDQTYNTQSNVDAILEICKTKRLELDLRLKVQENLQRKLSTLKIDHQFDDFFMDMGWSLIPGVPVVKKEKNERPYHFRHLDLDTGKLKTSLGTVDVKKEMEKSVLVPGIEKLHSLPQYDKSDKTLKAERKKEREKTKGPEWFDMAAPEVTEEVKNDLQILKMRSALDPKMFKKRNDMEVLPKYFQIGRIMDNPLEHQSERLTNKQRKRTMVDELLADAEFQRYNKKKYKRIIEEKRKTEYRTHMRDKRQSRKADIKKGKGKLKEKGKGKEKGKKTE